MNEAQALAHCWAGLELAVGDRIPPRLLLGRIIGRIVKPMALGNDEPMRRNSPTVAGLVVQDERDLGMERVEVLGVRPDHATRPPAASAFQAAKSDLQLRRSRAEIQAFGVVPNV